MCLWNMFLKIWIYVIKNKFDHHAQNNMHNSSLVSPTRIDAHCSRAIQLCTSSSLSGFLGCIPPPLDPTFIEKHKGAKHFNQSNKKGPIL